MTTVIQQQVGPGPVPAQPPGSTGAVIRVAVMRPGDEQAMLGMMIRCSRETLFHRFHGWTDGSMYAHQLTSQPDNQETFLARLGPICVGVASLHGETDGTAHLGVLVEDAWQRRGIGSQLIAALVRAARRRGVSVIHADVLGDNVFLVRALRRIGPATVSVQSGTYTVDIDISRRNQGDTPSPAPAATRPV